MKKYFLLFPTLLLLATTGSSQMDILNNSNLTLTEKVKLLSDNKEKMYDRFAGELTAGERTDVTEHKFTSDTDSANYEAEVSIAVNPTDSDNIVVSFMQNSGLPIYYSTDGGYTWSLSSFDAGAAAVQNLTQINVRVSGDPTFAFDNNGKLYFAWLTTYTDSTINSLDDVTATCWAYSTDQGASFQTAPGNQYLVGLYNTTQTMPVAGYGQHLQGFYDKIWLGCDRSGGGYDGNLYITSTLFTNNVSDWGIVMKTKVAGVDSFGARIHTGSHFVSQFSNVVVDDAGMVHVSYVDGNDSLLVHVSSNDGGGTFGAGHVIDAGGYIWGGFSGAHHVHARANGAPSLESAGNGILYIAWTDFINTSVNAYFSVSQDNGVTWSPKTNLESIDSLPMDKHLMPCIKRAPNGFLSMTYFGIESNGVGSYYYVESDDQGTTWSTPLAVSQSSTDFAHYYPGR